MKRTVDVVAQHVSCLRSMRTECIAVNFSSLLIGLGAGFSGTNPV